MALINIEYGSIASSSVMNANFEFLDDKIGETAENFNTSISSILSNIATINTSLGDLSNQIKDAIQDFNSKINELKNKAQIAFNEFSMVPNWNGCFSISSLNSYKVKTNGYLLLIPVNDSKGGIKINNTTVVLKEQAHAYDRASQVIVLPVSTDDIVTSNIECTTICFLPAAEISID